MKPAKPGLIPVFLLLLLVGRSATAQDIIFNNVQRPEENGWNIVTGITQDQQGYMWFGGNGLHRFDGVKVLTFRNDPLNPTTLANNAVEYLFTASTGVIWIGTLGAGLDRLDPGDNKFTHYRHQPDNPYSLNNDTITSIAGDQEGNLWIGTHGGLEQLIIKTGQFIHYRHNANDPGSLSNNHVRTVYVDRRNTVWVGTGSPFFNDAGVSKDEGGLNQFSKATGKFTRYLHDPADSNSLADNRVRAIFEDSRGTLWIGSAGDGLHSLDRITGKITRYRYDPAHPDHLSRPPLKNTLSFVDDHITFIREDATGSLWFGTMMNGLTRFNPATGQLNRYGTGNDSTGTFTDNSGWAAYTSRDGMLWISTWQSNLFRIDPLRTSYTYFNTGENINGLYRDNDGSAWMCTANSIIHINPDRQVLKKYPFELPVPLKMLDIFDFYRDHSGVFWIAANPGLFSFDPQTEKYSFYLNNPADQHSLFNDFVISICEDAEKNLWVGTLGALDKLNRKTGKFIHYRHEEKNTNTLAMNIMRHLFIDRQNRFWIATGDGINLFNTPSGSFKTYIRGGDVNDLIQDASGTIWVGGNDGLFRFNPGVDSFSTVVNPGSGLRFKTVYRLDEDNENRLWIFTATGIYSFNQKRDSSNFFEGYFGLRNIQNAGRVTGAGQKGELFFSDRSGYYDIQPSAVKVNPIPPQITFSSFRLGEQAVVPGSNSPLNEPISQAKTIELNYRQNDFSFEFDVLHFSNPGYNQYLFRLENYDDSWHQQAVDRRVFYFNVPPGHYTFRVRAANSNGIWTERNIQVIIRPPWWRTWWAYILYGLLFIVMILLANRYIRNRILEKEKIKNREKELAHAREIEKAFQELKLTQAQLIQAEKMASLGELTAGIAHEIQNPLNFVNNFSEINTELLEELKNQKSTFKTGDSQADDDLIQSIIENEKKINHHGKRADSIVKGMLQHSRSSSGQKEPTDINALADEYLRLSYHGLRAKDKVFNASLHTNFDPGIGKINIIPQDIGRVLLNLFNNAFYAVSEKNKNSKPGDHYEPGVWLTTGKTGNTVTIRVKDNGTGIPSTIADKIFQPFFTTKPTGEGTGLGLSLSYDIIKAHGGHIEVKSNEGKCTEFILTLMTLIEAN